MVTIAGAKRGTGQGLDWDGKEDPDPPADRRFLLWSCLGIAWGLAHIGTEMAMGTGNFRRWVVLLVVWGGLLALALARRGRRLVRWALLAAGACGGLALPVRHFDWELWPAAWFGVIPRIATRPEVGPAWAVTYNLLIYLGLVIGGGLLWSGSRAVVGGLERRRQAVRIALFALLLLPLGTVGGYYGRGHAGWTALIALLIPGALLLSAWLAPVPRRGPVSHRAAVADDAAALGRAV